VALPSWSVLSNRGGYEYQVRVTYRGRSVVLPVWDVGPWNTRDDYWNPNRRYGDLPVGMPMAQAARQHGYNGGRDEFGRRIRLPNGIDIADGAFWDDLGMTDSDWVEVTFLWLGADPHAAAGEVEAAGDEPAVIEPDALVVDDGGQGYEAPDGKWYDAPCGLNGRHAWTFGTPDPQESNTRATWRAALPGEGLYELFAFIPACGETPTASARYRVAHNGAVTEVIVDQAASSGAWASLGVYHMGQGAQVELSDLTGDEGRVVRFDALKWLPRGDTAPPDARVTEATLQPDGVLVRWSGSDDVSGVASYDVQVRLMPDGGWSDWQRGATTSEALFTPPGPGEYAFRARARDWLGHEQPWRDGPDVTVRVGE
jgi:hypothetical protein